MSDFNSGLKISKNAKNSIVCGLEKLIFGSTRKGRATPNLKNKKTTRRRDVTGEYQKKFYIIIKKDTAHYRDTLWVLSPILMITL